MFALAVAALMTGELLSASPTPSILVVPATKAARPVCEELLEDFTNEQVRVKLAGEKSEAVGCMARPAADQRECLVDALKDARVDGVVIITATGKAPLLVGLQLLSRTGEPHGQQTVRTPRARLLAQARPAVSHTIAALRGVLQAEEAVAQAAREQAQRPPVEDTPRRQPDAPEDKPALTPRDTPPPVEITAAPPPPVARPRGAAWAMTAVAIAGAGTAGAFGTIGYLGKTRLDQTNVGVSELTYTEARTLRDSTNLQLSVALGAGITAGVAAVIAGVLWAQ
jgi:hypothetical protein